MVLNKVLSDTDKRTLACTGFQSPCSVNLLFVFVMQRVATRDGVAAVGKRRRGNWHAQKPIIS